MEEKTFQDIEVVREGDDGEGREQHQQRQKLSIKMKRMVKGLLTNDDQGCAHLA